MAKQTTEKKEFAWDTEKLIGVSESEKFKVEVRICTLNGNTFVSSTTYIASAKAEDGWKRTKNNSMKIEVFKQVQELVGDWELTEAFEGTEGAKVVKKAAATKKKQKEELETMKEELKKEEPKKGTLKAKKQAEGAKEKASRKKKEDK